METRGRQALREIVPCQSDPRWLTGKELKRWGDTTDEPNPYMMTAREDARAAESCEMHLQRPGSTVQLRLNRNLLLKAPTGPPLEDIHGDGHQKRNHSSEPWHMQMAVHAKTKRE